MNLTQDCRRDSDKPNRKDRGEPVAWLVQHSETGHKILCDTEALAHDFGKSNPRWIVCTPLYTAPQPQFTLEELQSVLDALEIGEQHSSYMSQLTGQFKNLNTDYLKIVEAIALLKGMK